MLPEQRDVLWMGGTMRLGAQECRIEKGTVAARAYGSAMASERHRHRYEVNPAYVQRLQDKGLVVSATHPKAGVVEITEWKDSFGVATQAHIELKSRLETPAPLFVEFMKAAKDFRGKPSKSAGETHGE